MGRPEITCLFLFWIICGLSISQGANILFYWSISGMSHRISVWPLVEKLAQRGHNVTFLSPTVSKTPNPNVTEISSAFSFAMKHVNYLEARIVEGPSSIQKIWNTYLDFVVANCDALLSDQSTLDWIKGSSFDLIVINSFLNECAFGLAHYYNAPYIMYGTTSPFIWWTEAYGYFDEVYPEFILQYPEEMSFLQKVRTALEPLYWQFSREWDTFPKIEKLLREKLNLVDLPRISEMERNSSLLLLNSYFSEEYPRSFPPSVVQIAGMHCTDDRKPLSKDVVEFIDTSGSDGFIFFSYGTFASSKDLIKPFQDLIFNAMGNLTNLQFIVKWHEDISHKLPKNIKTVTWISQQDLFAHPKIRAFISHGGSLSTQEAVYFGVPTIVMPLFADQDFNALRIQSRRRGIRLEVWGLTQSDFETAILTIISDDTYRQNTLEASRLFKDRLNKPVDTALWWVEYVLRNKDSLNAPHLRPLGTRRTWYERRMLDVWGFICLVVLCGSLLILFAVVKIVRLTTNNEKVRKPPKNTSIKIKRK